MRLLPLIAGSPPAPLICCCSYRAALGMYELELAYMVVAHAQQVGRNMLER